MAAARPPIGGCDFPVDPDIEAPAASVFWNPADAPAIVSLVAALPDIGVESANITALPTAGREIESGRLWLRLQGGAVLVGHDISDRKPLGVLLPFDDQWPIRLAAADRLRRNLEHLPAHPTLTPLRRERLKRGLRTVDARRTGASYRAIAVAFYGERRVAEEPWKTSSLKAQVARLAVYGRMLIDHGYRYLLKGKSR